MSAARRLVPLPSSPQPSALREKPLLVFTPGEAAEVLRCSRQYVHALIKRGELRSVKLGRRRLIPIDALRELLARLEAEQR